MFKKILKRYLERTKYFRVSADNYKTEDKKLLSSLPWRRRRRLEKLFTENALEKMYSEKEPLTKRQRASLVVKEKEQLKKYKRNKIKTSSNVDEVLKLLNKTFTLNKNVKKKAYQHIDCSCYECWWSWYTYWYTCCECTGSWLGVYTEVNYTLRDREYSRKTKYIKTAISLIQDNRLPIKYGKKDWVVFFEYRGSQVSFHDPKRQINCKPFDWEWTWIKNKRIPFILKK